MKSLANLPIASFLLAGALLTLQAAAAEAAKDIGIESAIDLEALGKILPDKPPYSPYAGRAFPIRPLFGDTHTHTSYSLDAGAAGARLDPVEAFRFGKGEEVISSSGQPVKLSRPLDFMVVADHSDGFGLFPRLLAGDPELLDDPQVRSWYDLIQGGKGMEAAYEIVQAQSSGKIPERGAGPASFHGKSRAGPEDHGLGTGLLGVRRRVGDGEHARGEPRCPGGRLGHRAHRPSG